MSQDSGACKVGHHSFRVYWSLRVGMLSFPSSTSYSSDGSWKLVIKVKSPVPFIFRWERFRCKLKEFDDIIFELS